MTEKPTPPTVDQLLFSGDVAGLAAAEAEYRQAALEYVRAAERIRAVIATCAPVAAAEAPPASAVPLAPVAAPPTPTPTPDQVATARALAEERRRREALERVERIVRKVRGSGPYQPGECFREACYLMTLQGPLSVSELAARTSRPPTSMRNPLTRFEGTVFRRTRDARWDLVPGVGAA